MIPNDFGIVRQADFNLFSLLFPPLTDISEYEFEIIHPEYIEGYRVNADGSLSVYTNGAYAIIDVSKYDYVLIPNISQYAAGRISGFRADPATGAINTDLVIEVKTTSSSRLITGWAICDVNPSKPYAVLNGEKSMPLPVIGFIRHRSDHVNPLGIIQPLNPGAIQLDDPEPDPEDQEER